MSVSAQKKNNEFFKTFSIGSSLTYIWDLSKDKNNLGPEYNYKFKEYTWNINVSASVSKKIDIGFQALNIFTSGTRVENSQSQIFGLFSQYNFLGGKKTPTKLFIEGSINKGNYYTGGTLDPYLREGLYYVGCGMGLDIPLRNISKNIFLDVAFMNYWILNDIFDKYNYTQYIIGLNYYIGKRVHKL